MLIASAALLRSNPTPTEDEALDALGGVLCRCTGYRKIVQAVLSLTPNQPDLSENGGTVGAPVPASTGGQRCWAPTCSAMMWPLRKRWC